jgi:hypothetical protein
MTSPSQPKSTPVPAVLVYGTPTSPELTQASWFRAEDRQAAKAAAEKLKFSVIEINSEPERALLVGVHEGVLKGSGRMIVGSVTSEVYRRIEDYARKSAGAGASPTPTHTETAAPKSSLEQNMNHTTASAVASAPPLKNASPTSPDGKPVSAASSAASPTDKPDPVTTALAPWNSLRVGSHVVAKHWEADGEPYGWWIGKVTGFEKDEFVVVWLDYPSKMPPFRIERKNVAILHPAFDLKTERERKRR